MFFRSVLDNDKQNYSLYFDFLKIELLPHLTLWSSLAPSDYHLSRTTAHFSQGKTFRQEKLKAS